VVVLNTPSDGQAVSNEDSDNTSLSIDSLVKVYGITITLFGILLGLGLQAGTDQSLASLVGICFWVLSFLQEMFGTDLFANCNESQSGFRITGLAILAWAVPVLLFVVGGYAVLKIISFWFLIGIIILFLVPVSWTVVQAKDFISASIIISIATAIISLIVVNLLLSQVILLNIIQHFEVYLLTNSILVLIESILFSLWSIRIRIAELLKRTSEVITQAQDNMDTYSIEQNQDTILLSIEAIDASLATMLRSNRQDFLESIAMVFGRSKRRAQVFQAIDGRKSIIEISEYLGMSSSAVSREATILKNTGLIQVKEIQGRQIIYKQSPINRILDVDGMLRRRFT
jgi:DNA-binding transcriptional ArsR family regulator